MASTVHSLIPTHPVDKSGVGCSAAISTERGESVTRQAVIAKVASAVIRTAVAAAAAAATTTATAALPFLLPRPRDVLQMRSHQKVRAEEPIFGKSNHVDFFHGGKLNIYE